MDSGKIKINRRGAIKGIAAISTTGLLGSTGAFAMDSMERKTIASNSRPVKVDAVVVGSTPRQLEKAIRLESQGHKVAVLDCRPAVGGGIHSRTEPFKIRAARQMPRLKTLVAPSSVTNDEEYQEFLLGKACNVTSQSMNKDYACNSRLSNFFSRTDASQRLAQRLNSDVHLNFGIADIQETVAGLEVRSFDGRSFHARQIVWAS